ncbi:MAG TPA: Rnase Y domain-containing protein, partial [Balneolaceae bacterium]|nr:Rnase Y domain-containing protein [Balneolaceae bacterium]
MGTLITVVIVGIIGLVLGYVIANYIGKRKAASVVDEAKANARVVLKEAQAEGENAKKNKLLQAKEKFIELKAEHEKVIAGRDKKMAAAEKRIKQKESKLSKEL